MDLSNSTSLFMLHPDLEMRNFGYSYFLFALFTFPLYFIVIKTVYLKDKETPNFTYKLMNIINFTQLTQAVAHFLTSPAQIFPNIMKQYGFIINVIGCTFNTFWIADFPMITLLAVSRILIFTNKIGIQKFPKSIKLYLLVSWSWMAFVLVFGSMTQNLIFVSPGWDYDFNVPYGRLFSDLEIVVSIVSLAVSYFCYVFMAYLIFKRKNLTNSVSSRRNEIAILIQSTFVTTYIAGMIVTWHQALFSMIGINMESKTSQAIVNSAFILHCYIHPLTLLICNKSIRQLCIKILGFRKKSGPVSKTENTSKRFYPNQNISNTFLVMK